MEWSNRFKEDQLDGLETFCDENPLELARLMALGILYNYRASARLNQYIREKKVNVQKADILEQIYYAKCRNPHMMISFIPWSFEMARKYNEKYEHLFQSE